jgi:hypothetical protein
MQVVQPELAELGAAEPQVLLGLLDQTEIQIRVVAVAAQG